MTQEEKNIMNIAIEGDPRRCDEIITFLESLGGVNVCGWKGCQEGAYYAINPNKAIACINTVTGIAEYNKMSLDEAMELARQLGYYERFQKAMEEKISDIEMEPGKPIKVRIDKNPKPGSGYEVQRKVWYGWKIIAACLSQRDAENVIRELSNVRNVIWVK